MEIRINTHSYEGTAVISLRGALSARYCEDLEQSVRTGLLHARILLIDCRELDLLDSTGLGALIRCLRASLSARARMALVNVQASPRMVLELTRTHQLFDVYDSVPAALASLALEELPA